MLSDCNFEIGMNHSQRLVWIFLVNFLLIISIELSTTLVVSRMSTALEIVCVRISKDTNLLFCCTAFASFTISVSEKLLEDKSISAKLLEQFSLVPVNEELGCITCITFERAIMELDPSEFDANFRFCKVQLFFNPSINDFPPSSPKRLRLTLRSKREKLDASMSPRMVPPSDLILLSATLNVAKIGSTIPSLLLLMSPLSCKK